MFRSANSFAKHQAFDRLPEFGGAGLLDSLQLPGSVLKSEIGLLPNGQFIAWVMCNILQHLWDAGRFTASVYLPALAVSAPGSISSCRSPISLALR